MLKILLPTDFSDNAQKAIDYALGLLEKEECTLYLLHAYHDAPSAAATKNDLENALKKLVKSIALKNENQKHYFEQVFLMDSVVNALNITMIDKAINYIFMGTKGVSSLINIFLGSTTVRVIKELDTCPIVAVPADYECTPPKEIVFANDFKHMFIVPELTPIIHFSKLWKSSLYVVHILSEKTLNKEQKQNKKLLKNALKEINTSFLEVPMGTSIASTLYQLEKENNKIGMVSLLKTKHGFFDNLLHEPVLQKMAFQTQVPLLILPQIA